ncbi:MAG: hypothetical protein ACYDA6_09920 [Solirubrobacteraceae bacterium]
MPAATPTRPPPGGSALARLRAVPSSRWALGGLLALIAVALAGYLAYPTYPTYDSFYALLWGRELLHGHLPDITVYRAPTEHPLAIAFGALCALFGQTGARLMVGGSIASFVALVAGSYRVGRLAFGPLVGWIAALLMLTRFYDENLTVQGYLDISYLALVVWATALEIERPRRGRAVFLLLAAAGLLRPDAWVLSGVYWLWCASPVLLARLRVSRLRARAVAAASDWRRLAVTLALAVAAPVIWAAFDAILTGNPLHSLSATTELAGELERSHGLSGALASVWPFAVRIDKQSVVVGTLIGAALALYLVPRRALIPLAVLLVQLAVFLAEGAAGAAVINRYMLGAVTAGLVFAAFALGGWSVLERSRLRLAWIAAAAVLVAYGVANVLATFHVSELSNTMAYHEDFHRELGQALADAPVRRTLARCPVLSLPDNKLIPDARWILGEGSHVSVLARSQAGATAAAGDGRLARRLAQGSVAVYPLGAAVFFEAIVDPGDDPRNQVPEAGYRRLYANDLYAVYANC